MRREDLHEAELKAIKLDSSNIYAEYEASAQSQIATLRSEVHSLLEKAEAEANAKSLAEKSGAATIAKLEQDFELYKAEATAAAAAAEQALEDAASVHAATLEEKVVTLTEAHKAEVLRREEDAAAKVFNSNVDDQERRDAMRALADENAQLRARLDWMEQQWEGEIRQRQQSDGAFAKSMTSSNSSVPKHLHSAKMTSDSPTISGGRSSKIAWGNETHAKLASLQSEKTALKASLDKAHKMLDNYLVRAANAEREAAIANARVAAMGSHNNLDAKERLKSGQGSTSEEEWNANSDGNSEEFEDRSF